MLDQDVHIWSDVFLAVKSSLVVWVILITLIWSEEELEPMKGFHLNLVCMFPLCFTKEVDYCQKLHPQHFGEICSRRIQEEVEIEFFHQSDLFFAFKVFESHSSLHLHKLEIDSQFFQFRDKYFFVFVCFSFQQTLTRKEEKITFTFLPASTIDLR